MKMVLLVFLLIVRVIAIEYYCDSDRFPLVTDLVPEDCDNSNYYFYKENIINDCFPACVETNQYIPQVDCSDVLLCPPGYYCPNSVGPKCTINETSCYRYYISVHDMYTNAKWKPNCLPNESWAPKQCKGEPANGRCFCVDAQGKRIFGEEFSYNAEDMTCACSRRRNELENVNSNAFISLHCDSMGNYEPLQCDVDSKQCWCVETKTGDVTATVVPLSLMSKLSCYNATTVGSQYLRQCESQVYAQRKATDEFLAHGTQKINFPTLVCQYDGSYGPYKIYNGIVYCVWKDDSALGSYQTSLDSSITEINCNCARDQKIYSLEGLSHTLSCKSNGNYNPSQLDGTEHYCVDDDGFMKSDLYINQPDCSNFV